MKKAIQNIIIMLFAVYLKGDVCISGDIHRKPNIKFSEKKKRGTK